MHAAPNFPCNSGSIQKMVPFFFFFIRYKLSKRNNISNDLGQEVKNAAVEPSSWQMFTVHGILICRLYYSVLSKKNSSVFKKRQTETITEDMATRKIESFWRICGIEKRLNNRNSKQLFPLGKWMKMWQRN